MEGVGPGRDRVAGFPPGLDCGDFREIFLDFVGQDAGKS